MAKAAVELIRAPTGQLKARRQDLIARVAALKEFLAKNVPANRHLVPMTTDFWRRRGPAGGRAAAEPAAAKVAGARGGK